MNKIVLIIVLLIFCNSCKKQEDNEIVLLKIYPTNINKIVVRDTIVIDNRKSIALFKDSFLSKRNHEVVKFAPRWYAEVTFTNKKEIYSFYKNLIKINGKPYRVGMTLEDYIQSNTKSNNTDL